MKIDAEQQPETRQRLDELMALDVPAEVHVTEWHQPDTAAGEDGLYILRRDLHVELPDGDILLVERVALDKFDGISIPRGWWTAAGVRPGGRCRLAATVHDFLYKFGGLVQVVRDGKRVWRKFTRRECDWIFNWLMKRASARWKYRVRCGYCWLGVRSPGGQVAWFRHWLRNRQSRHWKAMLILAEDDKRPLVWNAHAKRREADDGGDA